MSARSVNRFFSLLVLVALLLQPLAVTGKQGNEETRRQGVAAPAPSGLYRTTVTVDSPARRARLEALGVIVLTTDEGRTTKDELVVLADADQLEALARLRFEPRASDDADALIAAHAAAQPDLAAAWGELRQRIETDKRMTTAAASLSAYPLTSVAALSSIDDDADGLTNTEEAWWCTDPLNPDTDADGRSDGAEIQVLKDWMGNKRAGPPNETPWPSWPFNATTCPDKDHDSIPNMAERWELGLNMDMESTDRDRYDDGQELFGITYCPGSGSACGYGSLPSANHDGVLVFPQMPSWVTGAGKHPLVAAYPKIDFAIVKDSDGFEFKVRTATVVTTDQRHEEGETKSYSTTKTEGTSTSDAETETWENWQEYSKTTEAAMRAAVAQGAAPQDTFINSTEQRLQVTNVRMKSVTNNTMKVKINNTYNQGGGSSLGSELSAPVTSFVVDEACAEMGCRKYIGSGIKASVRTFADVVEGTLLGTSDKIQNEFQANKCDPTSFNPNEIWCRIKSAGTLWTKNYDERLTAATTAEQEANGVLGGNYLQTGPSSLDISRVYPITFPEPRFIPTETNTSGSSTGGARTTTNTTYEEHAVTEGTAKQLGQSWGTATAQNSVHAADLWFAYTLSNTGNDYARVICDLAINVYIGDLNAPVATYYPGNDQGGDGCFSNFQPGESHKYSFATQSRIALTLDQLAAIDQGEAVRLVIEDYSLGQDDFYASDAIGAGVQIAIEDGTADGDEAIDTYVIPTWGSETVLDVLARYFPHDTDADGMMVTIWTPEYRADTPTWCADPRVVGTGSQQTLWCRHALSTADWWNVYTNGMGDGAEGFQDTPASPGSVALFRFNQDSDFDGYSDRSEERLGTEPNDPASFPRPELIAGVHSFRSGNNVVATLSLLNTGVYDAYGIEAVMIAPNDTISITNNTVGGSGRVRAQKQVIVGSRIAAQTPLPAAWLAAGHAKPAAGGYYTGTVNLTYTFTATDSGSVGAGTLRLNWSNGAGGSGTLNFGASYLSPTLLDVSNGVKLGLLSGTVAAGESFTLATTTPRDTFQYAIAAGHENDFTPPVVLVSYNDPQGNHRFGIPPAAANLGLPSDNLMAFSGQMLQEPGVEIVTAAAATAGANTTNLVVNNPTGATLTNARLFLEFVDITGTVTSEIPVTTNLPPGPNVVPVDWSTGSFSPAYDPAQDYIVMAFLTDYQGNILDTAARPLSSFQEDPKPAFAMATADATWDFGTAAQGTLLKRSFTFANTGALDLLTYVSAPAGLTVSQTGSRRVGLADMTTYEMALNTASLSAGPYDGTINIRTSDPDARERTVHVVGTITTAPADTPTGAMQRPLDTAAPVSGTQGQWVDFAHTLQPDPVSLHPVKVYSQDYSSPKGVGKYATPFAGGTASYEMFGNGADGNLLVASGETRYMDEIRTPVAGTANGTVLPVANTTGFSVGDEVVVLQMQGPGAGVYEFGVIASVQGSSLVLRQALQNNYSGFSYNLNSCGGVFRGEYYANPNLSGSPTLVRCDPTIWFDWGDWSPGTGLPSDNFSTRWTAQLTFPANGNYTFRATTDDGVRIYIDGVPIINEWHPSDSSIYSASPWLSIGPHTVVIEHYEGGGKAKLFVELPVNLGFSAAQVVRVPHYSNVNVASGGRISVSPWNGITGGVLAFRAAGQVVISGVLDAMGTGYRGFEKWPSQAEGGHQGESLSAMVFRSRSSNVTGGGGGAGGGDGGAGGSGGSYASGGTVGSSPNNGIAASAIVGTEALIPATFFGGAGGSGGSDDSAGPWDPYPCGMGGKGGGGGGIVAIFGRDISVLGAVKADGQRGTDGGWLCSGGAGGGAGGAGGAGGSILIKAGKVSLGNNIVSAVGGGGGAGVGAAGGGGSGGIGRIRIEYCDISSGFTNPSASSQKLNCYIVEQIESAPYTSARLNLPESGPHTYQVQYGRKLNWGGAANQVTSLRVPAGLFTSVTLQSLVSDLPSNAAFALDVGNTGSDSWSGTVGNGGEYTSPNLAAYFNAYWASHGAPTTGTLDVPIRVYLDRAGQVLLTNLQVTPTGSRVRAIRLPVRPQGYSSVTASFTVSGSAGPLAVGVDVGGDGSVDWTTTGSPAYPASLTTGNLAAAVNAYLAGKPDPVDIPIRFYLAPFATLNLTGFTATPVGGADASIGAGDVSFSAPTPTEGDELTINAMVHNGGTLTTGPLTAAFYATPAGGTPWYIGSAFVGNVAAAGTATVPLPWNTLGFIGTVPVRVVVDPYNRVAELSETNNVVTATVNIRTRPDLSLNPITLSDDEPVAGETVTVTLPLHNNGQTTAIAQTVALYDGNPDAGGTLVETLHATSLQGGATTNVTLSWTPLRLGLHRLFARADRDRQVNESDEGNNDKWLDVYVGFGAPVALDSGAPAADPAYTTVLGYGAVDTGQPDAVVTCAGRADPTLRRDPDNRVGYRFDHLQPGRFYHLDVVLYECDNANRIERVLVDDMLVGGPVDLGDQAEHRLSIRLDPALYRDHVINVAVIGADGSQRSAVVASVALREIDYRYADSGGATDPAYTPERGWGYLDGVAFAGSLPYRSARVDQTDNEVRYRFDRLDPAKRYQAHLTFWQATGNPLLQRIRADGLDTGTTVNLVAGTPISATVRLSPATYAADGSVIVSVVVLNASANATVNEIALEEETLLAESPCRVVETPNYSLAFGFLTVNGTAAPVGTVVTAESPRGDVVGCYIVGTDGSPAGQYGFVPVYGEDTGASPAIPGMRDGELITFRVDGALAQAAPAFYWQDDRTEHQADLTAAPLTGQAILLQANWNLLSLRVEPPVGLVESVLNSISGKFCRVLDEIGIYDCNVPTQFRSLKELHAGKGYYLRVDGGASANLLVEGIQAAPAMPIPLHPGWNWVGYLPDATLPITTALASISGAYQRVQGLSQFYDIRYPTFSTLKQLTPGQGYLIYATSAATLTYPAAAAAQADANVIARSGVCEEAISSNERDCFANNARNDGNVCNVTPTPNLTLVFGGLTLNSQTAPIGTRVEALTLRGDVAGCFVVDTPGQYGFMPLYGEDASAAPPIPGFREGEAIRLRVNGLVVTKTDLAWENDRAPHQFNLAGDFNRTWLPAIVR